MDEVAILFVVAFCAFTARARLFKWRSMMDDDFNDGPHILTFLVMSAALTVAFILTMLMSNDVGKLMKTTYKDSTPSLGEVRAGVPPDKLKAWPAECVPGKCG